MSSPLDDLRVRLGLDLSPYEQGLVKALEKFDVFEQSISRIAGNFDKITKAAAQTFTRTMEAGASQQAQASVEQVTATEKALARMVSATQNALNKIVKVQDDINLRLIAGTKEGVDKKVAIIQVGEEKIRRAIDATEAETWDRVRLSRLNREAAEALEASARIKNEENVATTIARLEESINATASRRIRERMDSQITTLQNAQRMIERRIASSGADPFQQAGLKMQMLGAIANQLLQTLDKEQAKIDKMTVDKMAAIEKATQAELAAMNKVSAESQTASQKKLENAERVTAGIKALNLSLEISETQIAVAAVATQAKIDAAAQAAGQKKIGIAERVAAGIARMNLSLEVSEANLALAAAASQAKAVAAAKSAGEKKIENAELVAAAILKLDVALEVAETKIALQTVAARIKAEKAVTAEKAVEETARLAASKAAATLEASSAQRRANLILAIDQTLETERSALVWKWLSKRVEMEAEVVEAARRGASQMAAVERQLTDQVKVVWADRTQAALHAAREQADQLIILVSQTEASAAEKLRAYTAIFADEEQRRTTIRIEAAQHRARVVERIEAAMAAQIERITLSREEQEVLAVARGTAERIAAMYKELGVNQTTARLAAEAQAASQQEITAIRNRHAQERQAIAAREADQQIHLYRSIGQAADHALRNIIMQLQVIAGLYLGMQGFRFLEEGLIENNAQLEKMKIGLAAVGNAVGNITSQGVKMADGPERFAVAAQEASRLVEQLRVDAIKTIFTSQQLVQAATALSSPVLNAGRSYGELRKVVNLTATTAAVLGMNLQDAARQVQEILTGAERVTTPMVRLMGGKEEVEQFLGMFKDRLTGMEALMQRFRIAAEAHMTSWEGATATVRDFQGILMQIAGESLFTRMRDDILAFVKQAEQIDALTGAVLGLNPALQETARTIGDQLAGAYEATKQAIVSLGEALNPVVGIFRALSGVLVPLIGGFIAFRAALLIQPLFVAFVSGIYNALAAVVVFGQGLVAIGVEMGVAATATGVATVAFQAFATAVAGNIFAIVLTGIALYTAHMWQAAQATEAARAARHRLMEEETKGVQNQIASRNTGDDLIRQLKDVKAEMDGSAKGSQKAAEAQEKYNGIKDQMIALGGPYAAAMKHEADGVVALIARYDALSESMHAVSLERERIARVQLSAARSALQTAKETRAVLMRDVANGPRDAFGTPGSENKGFRRSAATDALAAQQLVVADAAKAVAEGEKQLGDIGKDMAFAGARKPKKVSTHEFNAEFAHSVTLPRSKKNNNEALDFIKKSLADNEKLHSLTDQQEAKLRNAQKSIEKEEEAASKRGAAGAARAHSAKVKAGKEEVVSLEAIARKKGPLTEQDIRDVEAIQAAYAKYPEVVAKADGVVTKFASQQTKALDHARKMGWITEQDEMSGLKKLETRLGAHADAREALAGKNQQVDENLAARRRESLKNAGDAVLKAEDDKRKNEIAAEAKHVNRILSDETKTASQKAELVWRSESKMRRLRDEAYYIEVEQARQRIYKDVEKLKLTDAQKLVLDKAFRAEKAAIGQKYDNQNESDAEAHAERIRAIEDADYKDRMDRIQKLADVASGGFLAIFEAAFDRTGKKQGEAMLPVTKILPLLLGNVTDIAKQTAEMFGTTIQATAGKSLASELTAAAGFSGLALTAFNLFVSMADAATKAAAAFYERAAEQAKAAAGRIREEVGKLNSDLGHILGLKEKMLSFLPDPEQQALQISKLKQQEIDYYMGSLDLENMTAEEKKSIREKLVDDLLSLQDKLDKVEHREAEKAFFVLTKNAAPNAQSRTDDYYKDKSTADELRLLEGVEDPLTVLKDMAQNLVEEGAWLQKQLAGQNLSENKREELRRRLMKVDKEWAENWSKQAEIMGPLASATKLAEQNTTDASGKMLTLAGVVDKLREAMQKIIDKIVPPTTKDVDKVTAGDNYGKSMGVFRSTVVPKINERLKAKNKPELNEGEIAAAFGKWMQVYGPDSNMEQNSFLKTPVPGPASVTPDKLIDFVDENVRKTKRPGFHTGADGKETLDVAPSRYLPDAMRSTQAFTSAANQAVADGYYNRQQIMPQASPAGNFTLQATFSDIHIRDDRDITQLAEQVATKMARMVHR